MSERNSDRLKKLEHYCYLRWLKADSKEAELFWINKHSKIGDLMTKGVKV